MKIPKKINIGGMEIKIIIGNEKESDDNIRLGYFSLPESKIFLNKIQGKELMYMTFLHEVIESINSVYNINLKHKQIEKLEVALNALGTEFKKGITC